MRQTNGQTGFLVTLFILVLGLTGFVVYVYIQQGSATETLTKKIDDQDRDLRSAKSTIDELTRKIKSQKEAMEDQDKAISSLKSDSTALKSSVSKIQENVKNDIAAVIKDDLVSIKKESTQRLESFMESSTKIEVKLNELADQIKALKEHPPAVTPVIDVNMEPDQPTKSPKK